MHSTLPHDHLASKRRKELARILTVQRGIDASIQRAGGRKAMALRSGMPTSTLDVKAAPHSPRGLSHKELIRDPAAWAEAICALASLLPDCEADVIAYERAGHALSHLQAALVTDYAPDRRLNDPDRVVPVIDDLIDVLSDVRDLELSRDARGQGHLFADVG